MQHEISGQLKQSIYKHAGYMVLMLVAAAGFVALSAEPASAQQSPMGNVICMIIGVIYGNLGRGLSVLAVIVVGIGATLGKVSWGLAMTVAVGVGTVFGAVPLVAYLVSGSGSTPICFGVGGIS